MRFTRCVWPTVAVLAVGSATLAALAGASYSIGRGTTENAPELRFLDRRRPPTADEACLTFLGEYSLRSHEANDVIFLGDSGCRGDIDPLAFERRTGLRAYNLGTFGSSGPSIIVAAAKAYLSSHPRPRAVVLCLLPISLRYEAKTQVGTVAWRFAEAYASQSDRPAATDLGSGFGAVAYAIRRGASHAGIELRSLGSREPSDVLHLPLIGMLNETYLTWSEKLRAQRGRWILPGEHQANESLIPKQAGFVSPDWDRQLDDLARLCEAARIPLVFHIAPMRADMKATFAFSQATHSIEAVGARNPTVILERPILSYCDPALCWDSMHLNDKGAAEFTAMVAHDVEDALHSRRTTQGKMPPRRMDW